MNKVVFCSLFFLFYTLCFAQEEQLEVSGAIQIGDSQDPTPDAGTIRWNPTANDFEGFNGSNWVSLSRTEGINVYGVSRSTEKNKLIASDGADSDHFGYSVSIFGDYAVIGARYDDDNGNDSGSAYIFYRNGSGWEQQAKLIASDGASGDDFGFSVSIYGDYAIIGAYGNDENYLNGGSAYIFHRTDTSWTEQAKISASDAAIGDFFGYSVSISGDYAIVGAYNNDDDGTNSGSAYIFHRIDTLWVEQAILTADDAYVNDFFGYSVSISGDYAVSGAHFDDDNGTNSGSAYIFHRNGINWTQQAKVKANNGASGDFFGFSVSISGDYVLVGAHKDDDNGSNSGSAYIFHRNATSWTQQTRLLATDGSGGDDFGQSVSISGDYALIGARLDDDNGSNSGSAYIFHRTGTSWEEYVKLITSDGADNDFLGNGVSISGNYILIGAHYTDDDGYNRGSAYIY